VSTRDRRGLTDLEGSGEHSLSTLEILYAIQVMMVIPVYLSLRETEFFAIFTAMVSTIKKSVEVTLQDTSRTITGNAVL